jgi:Serpentine type 7TM GPCR chemoreceptor Srw
LFLRKSTRGGSKTRIKQTKLKEEKPPKDVLRKKSLANTSGASILLAGRLTAKDRRLLKMILVIFLSFLTCYLPITLSKVFKSLASVEIVYISGYLLVYLTTCINPIIYVVMSSEYRQAYKNLLMCRSGKSGDKYRNSRRRI